MARPIAQDTRDQIRLIIDSLPIITSQDLPDADDSCPICLTAFSSIFADVADPESGVTKLVACNHVFCRKDLTHWIQSLHGSCPTCRHTFFDIKTPSESDDESSDGGEYIPNERDEDFDDEDADGFTDTDEFSDAFGYATEDLEMDDADEWESETRETDADMEDAPDDVEEDASEWGLTDGGSSSMSEEAFDPAIENEDGEAAAALETGVSVSIQEDNPKNGYDDVVDPMNGQEEQK